MALPPVTVTLARAQHAVVYCPSSTLVCCFGVCLVSGMDTPRPPPVKPRLSAIGRISSFSQSLQSIPIFPFTSPRKRKKEKPQCSDENVGANSTPHQLRISEPVLESVEIGSPSRMITPGSVTPKPPAEPCPRRPVTPASAQLLLSRSLSFHVAVPGTDGAKAVCDSKALLGQQCAVPASSARDAASSRPEGEKSSAEKRGKKRERREYKDDTEAPLAAEKRRRSHSRATTVAPEAVPPFALCPAGYTAESAAAQEHSAALPPLEPPAELYRAVAHVNIVGTDDQERPFVATFLRAPVGGWRAVLRRPDGLRPLLEADLEAAGRTSPLWRALASQRRSGSPLELVRLAWPELRAVEARRVKDPRLSAALAQLDTAEATAARRLKLGLVEMRSGQTTDDAMYSNRNPSPALERFLALLGPVCDAAQLDGFRGGLHGTHRCIASQIGEVQVVWHVAALLPFSALDPQQVERKRHIGNDVVVVVFLEPGCETPFSPAYFRSHFNHVFILVRPEADAPDTQYQVAVLRKGGAEAAGPPLPVSGRLNAAELRDWLLQKALASERAALASAPDFTRPAARARLAFLRRCLLDYR